MIVRHGESEGNCDKSVNCHVPNHKVELTARGHQQAFEAGLRLRDMVRAGEKICFYTSPYMRTRQTLQGIIKGLDDGLAAGETKNEHVIYEEPRMREQDFGNFQGSSEEMRKIWIERAKYGHFFYRIPHGESAADVYDRCSSFNETLWRQFHKDSFPEVLVLVTHGIWARVFLQRWFRWSVEYFENLCNVPHCSWIVLEFSHDDLADRDHHGEGSYHLRTRLQQWSDAQPEDGAVGNGSNPPALPRDSSRVPTRDPLVYPY